MMYADKIHNQIITYAYNRALELEETARKIKQSIEDNQPSNAQANKPLNLGLYSDRARNIGQQLEELQEISATLYRIINQQCPPSKLFEEVEKDLTE